MRKQPIKVVKKLLKSQPNNLPKEAKFKGDIFVGDLQVTITRTERDNQGGYNRKQLEYGMRMACQNMILLVQNIML